MLVKISGRFKRVNIFISNILLYCAEMPVSHDISHLYAREDGRGGLRVIRESDSINESYDRYLQTGVFASAHGYAINVFLPIHIFCM